MHLIEAENVGPVEGDDPLVTPPRPPHRRVSVSLLFTLTILIGTVVAIYVTFPARHNVLLTEALDQHRAPGPWDLDAPTPGELRAWVIGFAGSGAPMPPTSVEIAGARQIEVLDRPAAVIRLTVGADALTYVLQRARGISPDHVEREVDGMIAVAWRRGPFAVVVVGPAASAATWRTLVR